MNQIDVSLIDWSRAQFALTAMYHWLFVPLTLGLGFIMCIFATYYYRTRDEKWKRTTQFWMKLFGVNFAVGVATGLILEFEFGTNWSNYSWFVGDIFGAPLAIEGIVAFFLEATFIGVMFFGWNKVSKKFHLASTWLAVGGATLSAWWILVANSWMQYPVGMAFNPDTVRNEMVSFSAVALSPVAVNKFFHTVFSAWMLGAVFVIGISSWYLLKKRDITFALDSIRVATLVGIAAILLTWVTAHSSAKHVADKQPMKLAAMEGLYDGGNGIGMVAAGILTPGKQFNDSKDPFVFHITFPKLLSFLVDFNPNSYIPGINDIVKGGYDTPKGKEISMDDKIQRGKVAIAALGQYTDAKKAQDTEAMKVAKQNLDDNFAYFGYGYFKSPADAIPNVPLTFYSFRVMITLAVFFLALFIVVWFYMNKKKFEETKWLQWVCIISIPLAYICSQAGWLVAEMGRQPWAIQDLLPVQAAVSKNDTASVQLTFFIFLILFTMLLIAELGIMRKVIKSGPEKAEIDGY
jgi:cytochrome d ubiquinol oxidase subunit I